jgi:hypothetical protein
MNLKLTFGRAANQELPQRPVPEIGSMRCTAIDEPARTQFTKYLGELGFAAIKNQKSADAPREKTVRKPQTPSGLLGRVLAWLNGSCAPEKQLRVLETVALGDKRMVAMIQADGRRFLVGGGPSGISLLTPLDQSQKPIGEIVSSARLRELAG